MKNRFSKITRMIRRNGFYIILFIGICTVVAAINRIGGQSFYSENLDKKDNTSQVEDFVILDGDKLEPSLEISRMEEQVVEDEEEGDLEELEEPEEGKIEEDIGDNRNDKDKNTDLEFVEEEKLPAKSRNTEDMMLPVDGELGMKFTTDNLVYSKTLEEWISHKGIDILANEGQEVKAALSGEVMEVYEDPLWGIVIIIDHGNGLMTKYANLYSNEMIKEGSKVNKGQVINKVGKSASIEMMENPHVHFEILEDGVHMNPKDYLSGLSY